MTYEEYSATCAAIWNAQLAEIEAIAEAYNEGKITLVEGIARQARARETGSVLVARAKRHYSRKVSTPFTWEFSVTR